MKSRTILSFLFTILFINLLGQDTTYSNVYPGTVFKFFEPAVIDDTLHLSSKTEIVFGKNAKVFFPERNEINFVRIINPKDLQEQRKVEMSQRMTQGLIYDPIPTDISMKNLNLAGFHLEKAGDHRSISTISLILGAGISFLIMAANVSNEPQSPGTSAYNDTTTPLIILGSSALISIGFKISGDSHEVKAGRILQGK